MIEGLSQQEAKSRIWMTDSRGLLCAERFRDLDPRKQQFANSSLPAGLVEPKATLGEVSTPLMYGKISALSPAV